MTIIKNLQNMISSELNELVWYNDYPINPAVGLWSFLEAIRQFGDKVEINDRNKEAKITLTRMLPDKIITRTVVKKYNEIISGWRQNVKGCPRSFYDSICQIYDDAKGNMNIEDSNIWEEMRFTQTRKIRDVLENNIKQYIEKYQENMLLSKEMKIPNLTVPKLFKQTLNKFPLHMLERAKYMQEEGSKFGGYETAERITPCAEILIDEKWSEFDENYYPTESVLNEYFCGLYLDELRKNKHYELKQMETGKKALRSLVISGFKAFELGQFTFEDQIKYEREDMLKQQVKMRKPEVQSNRPSL